VENGDAQVGEKRKADEKADAGTEERTNEEKEKEDEAKKQKTSNGTAAPVNGEKKKPGRPKANGEKKPKKEKKAPAVGRAERKTRSQGTA
jgi:hypothetical protein